MLPLLLLIPLIGTVAIIFTPAKHAKAIALTASLFAFIFSVVLGFLFDKWGTSEFGLTAEIPWFETFGVSLNMGADSVSMLLVLLTTLLMPLCVWGSATAITERLKEFYSWLLIIETAMVGVFVATDLIFFYVCFELTLIPMFFLIALFGGENRAKACIKFFIYTFTGSMIALAGFLYVAWFHANQTGTWTFDIATLTSASQQLVFIPFSMHWNFLGWNIIDIDITAQHLVLLALLAGFAVKVPLFPLHTWLPLAHTEAPTAGSVILASVLLKLGTYGLYRFVLPMAPDAVVEWAPFIAVLSIIGILYTALICWVQDDIKKLIAYSSVSHLGFCVLGLFALNPLGLQGSVLYMLNHGLSTGALFFLVGMIYERYHTRDMNSMSGLSKVMPIWSFFMVFFVLSSVGLPGLNGFISEFLCLIGTFTASLDNAAYPGVLGPWYAAIAGVGMIFAAMYLLIMVGKVVFGPLKEPAVHHNVRTLPRDLSFREISILLPLAVLCVYIGFRPQPFTEAIEGSIEHVLSPYPARVERLARQREALLSPSVRELTTVPPEDMPVDSFREETNDGG
ncbi:MAG: NADH-quinone oxidoreductase subunit M [Planctomycetes bacterium]|nr:NADH-quinone oxidoreductase subunit M [Planctomycetota bacterium]